MKTMLILFSMMVTSLCLCSQPGEIALKGRSSLELNIGLWGGGRTASNVTAFGVHTGASFGSFVGGLRYTHWVREELAVTLSAGLLSGSTGTEVSPGNVSEHSSAVVPVLLGVRYYPFGSTIDDVRPYLSAAGGPYIGAEVVNTTFSHEVQTESVFGGCFGGGVDFMLGNHFKLGANAGYNVVSDYQFPIGERRNYDGGEFSVAFGYVF
jgi:Outer membrane protein beta-barrel domain